MSQTRVMRISWTILCISVLYVIFTAAWIASENRTILPIMEVLTICSAVAILLFMVEVHRGASESHKSQSMAALALTAAMAVVTISNHFLYLTVLRQLYINTDMPAWLLLDGWPSITKGLECVAWGLFLGLALIFAADACRSLGRAIVWTLRISGIMSLAGLIGPAIGNMNLYIVSTVGYSVGFVVLSIEMILRFRGSQGLPAAQTPQRAMTKSGPGGQADLPTQPAAAIGDATPDAPVRSGNPATSGVQLD
jgi:hypothetical protein